MIANLLYSTIVINNATCIQSRGGLFPMSVIPDGLVVLGVTMPMISFVVYRVLL